LLFLALLSIASFLLTALFTPIMRKYALNHGIVDYPDFKIKTHSEIKPYLGGVAIFFALFLAIVFLSILTLKKFYPFFNLTFKQLVLIWQIFFCATIIMILGLIDDVKNLSPYTKLIAQIIVAIIIVRSDIQIKIKYFPDWINEVLSILWIVTMTNASNLIDIMDGLCSGVIAIASFTFLIAGLITNNIVVSLLVAIIFGNCIGFLLFNFKNASIYLGDAGSLMLGFLMAIISILMSYTERNQLGLLLPFVILAVPLYDLILVCYFRIKAGKSPIRGSKDHFALRLNFLGFTKTETVKLIYLINITLSIFAILILQSNLIKALILFVNILIIGLIFAKLLDKIKIPE
ncbi:MAG TPA: MraY family glycosyltransferase, partial [bacterium]|nr:MraY family glycosyltransferase [bacterium]